jgi:hypothetical protein
MRLAHELTIPPQSAARRSILLLVWLLSIVSATCYGRTAVNLPTVTHVEQIREMTIEEAARGYPVRLRAVVTYYNWDEGDLFIQDSTGGIRVEPGKTKLALPSAEWVQVEGISNLGDFAQLLAWNASSSNCRQSAPNSSCCKSSKRRRKNGGSHSRRA